MNNLIYKTLFNKLNHYLLTNNFDEELTQKQARAIFTTLCIVCDIEVDTAQAADILSTLYLENDIECVDITPEQFENIMYKDLV